MKHALLVIQTIRHKKSTNGFSQKFVVKMFQKQHVYHQPVKNMNVHPATQEWIIVMPRLANSVLKICTQMGKLVVNDVRPIPLQITVIISITGQKCQK
jgi:hypothetical protein